MTKPLMTSIGPSKAPSMLVDPSQPKSSPAFKLSNLTIARMRTPSELSLFEEHGRLCFILASKRLLSSEVTNAMVG